MNRRSPSSARQAPNCSESGKTGPPTAAPTARAARSGSPSTATSTSAQLAAEQRVAHHAADQPGRGPAGQRRADGTHRLA